MKNALRALREQRGWTQGELADRLEVSRQTVNELETGRYDPSLPLAFRIAARFERPVEAVFDPERDVAGGGGSAGEAVDGRGVAGGRRAR